MDILNDKSYRVFTDLASRLGQPLPDYVANYTPDREKIASELEDESFACPARREYPVDSAANTWMSALYAADSIHTGGKEARAAKDAIPSIKSAAIAWDILEDVENALAISEETEVKQASDDLSNYGWVDRDEDGNVVAKRYGIFDRNGVEKAAEYFLANRDHYHYKTREKIASFIVSKAAEYGVPEGFLGEDIEKEAGYGIPVKGIVMEEIEERARLSKHAECGTLLSNVNNLLDVCDPEELPEAMDKIAELINEFDLAEDLTGYYGKRITRPCEFLHTISEKEAEAAVENVIAISDIAYNVEKMAEFISANEFYNVLGPKFAAKISETGEFDEYSNDIVKVSADKLRREVQGLSLSQQADLHRHLVSLCD